MTNSNPYREILLRQREHILNSSSLSYYFRLLYEYIKVDIDKASKVLEIGSGSGVSELFLEHRNIVRTDYYAFPEFNVVGNCLMEALPFTDSEFDAVLAVDAVHHSISPIETVQEMIRVLSPGGTILIVEPFVSVFSFIPYFLFHNEDTSWRFRPKKNISEVSENLDPSVGDQGVSRFLIKELMKKSNVFENDIRIEICYLSWLEFFLTGGVNRPIPIPLALLKLTAQMERRIPKKLMKFLASRVIIRIQK